LGRTRGKAVLDDSLRLPSYSDSSYHQLMQKREAASGSAKTKTAPAEPGRTTDAALATVTTAIHIPRDTWDLLRAVAFHRAQDSGGRVSVSKLVAELVERHREELEDEVG